MEVNNIANVATALSNASLNQQVEIAVLKKAINSSAAGALALIEAIPDISAMQSLPAHLGRNINTIA